MGHHTRAAIRAIGTALVAGSLAVGAVPAGASTTGSGKPTAVIVRARIGATDSAAAEVVALGGRVGRILSIIDGFAATVPSDRVAELRSDPSVVSVTPDAAMRPMGKKPKDTTTTTTPETTATTSAPETTTTTTESTKEKGKAKGNDTTPPFATAPASIAALGYDTTTDMGSSSAITQMVGAQGAWAAGITGRGIGIALIDTGVTQVPGLDQGQVVDGPDLSFDSQNSNLAHRDAYGHGTHMASLLVGRDAGAVAGPVNGCSTCLDARTGYSDTTKFVGVAPDATLINVKVGAADGSADVSQVIAAIDWVVQHRNDQGFNIRVINLSYGTNSSQSFTIDPLAYAAEVAWRHGIVFVASGGNDGRHTSSLASPAYDPTILAVGGDDPMGTLDLADDTVPDFATNGSWYRPVDVAAPATHVLGLRVPGSYVDSLSDNVGKVGTRFQRGSGTSQAAAITSGVVALTLQKFPNATPDGTKQLIRRTTGNLKVSELDDWYRLYAGQGVPNATLAITTAWPPSTTSPGTFTLGKGTGTIEATRGGSHVTDGTTVLEGEIDIFGRSWRGKDWAADAFAGRSWRGGEWNGSVWTGDGWNGRSWRDATWTSLSWAGRSWREIAWDGRSWRDATWDGRSWRDADWSGRSWREADWSQSTWSSASWG